MHEWRDGLLCRNASGKAQASSSLFAINQAAVSKLFLLRGAHCNMPQTHNPKLHGLTLAPGRSTLHMTMFVLAYAKPTCVSSPIIRGSATVSRQILLQVSSSILQLQGTQIRIDLIMLNIISSG